MEKMKKTTHGLFGRLCPLGNSVERNRKDTHCKKTLISEGGGSRRTPLSLSLFGSIITCTFSSVFMPETKCRDWSRDESF